MSDIEDSSKPPANANGAIPTREEIEQRYAHLDEADAIREMRNDSRNILQSIIDDPSHNAKSLTTIPPNKVTKQYWDDVKRASMFLLGEELLLKKTVNDTHFFVLGGELGEECLNANRYILELLQTLIKNVKNGCCDKVGVGYQCGHCDASLDVIRISRAVILSLCDLPYELVDSNKQLQPFRNLVAKVVTEDWKWSDIEPVLPPKLSAFLLDGVSPNLNWDIESILQKPAAWLTRVHFLFLVGFRVALVNFDDVARLKRKEKKTLYSNILEELSPRQLEGGDERMEDVTTAMETSCNISDSAGAQPNEFVDMPDEELFKQPPTNEDCPICFLPMPHEDKMKKYYECCGKVICMGCMNGYENVRYDLPSEDELMDEAEAEEEDFEDFLSNFEETPTDDIKAEIWKLQQEQQMNMESVLQRLVEEGEHAGKSEEEERSEKPAEKRDRDDDEVDGIEDDESRAAKRHRVRDDTKILCKNSPLWNEMCPFCRVPSPDTDKQLIERLTKQIDAGDAEAMYILGCYYADGRNGLPRKQTMAVDLWNRAGELGNQMHISRLVKNITLVKEWKEMRKRVSTIGN